MTKKIWIVPRNDLEATEIIRLLEQYGETVIVSQQAWGACWEKLEADIASSVEELLRQNPDAEIVGIELAGAPRWNGQNIDHHRWADGDRSCEQSSLEQVAEILGHELNRYERLVAINDKGWIPALVAAGASASEIDTIRMADRCAQGVTPDDEATAMRAIEAAQWLGDRKVVVVTTLSTQRLSPISDRLYGCVDEKLVCGGNGWLYTGPRHRELFDLVHASGFGCERDWVGGAPASGYAGFVDPVLEAQKIIDEFFRKE